MRTVEPETQARPGEPRAARAEALVAQAVPGEEAQAEEEREEAGGGEPVSPIYFKAGSDRFNNGGNPADRYR